MLAYAVCLPVCLPTDSHADIISLSLSSHFGDACTSGSGCLPGKKYGEKPGYCIGSKSNLAMLDIIIGTAC